MAKSDHLTVYESFYFCFQTTEEADAMFAFVGLADPELTPSLQVPLKTKSWNTLIKTSITQDVYFQLLDI